jgi:hypothetical protein
MSCFRRRRRIGATRHAAVRIIEGSDLLMMPGREAAPAGAKSEAEGVELEPTQITALVKKNRKAFDSFAMACKRSARNRCGRAMPRT